MIGAGKSTLATALARHLDIDAYYEPVADNEYLEDFYRDTKSYAFATQVYLLNRRFQQHQEIIWRGRSAVQDRTIYEDSIFARMLADTGLMDERDYRTYVQLFRHMSNFMCRPSVIVYLDVPPERSMERIRSRSRDVESGISVEYLRALYDAYGRFVRDISKTIPVIRVDYDRFATDRGDGGGDQARVPRPLLPPRGHPLRPVAPGPGSAASTSGLAARPASTPPGSTCPSRPSCSATTRRCGWRPGRPRARAGPTWRWRSSAPARGPARTW
jgi:deoxyadenosine kinase